MLTRLRGLVSGNVGHSHRTSEFGTIFSGCFSHHSSCRPQSWRDSTCCQNNIQSDNFRTIVHVRQPCWLISSCQDSKKLSQQRCLRVPIPANLHLTSSSVSSLPHTVTHSECCKLSSASCTILNHTLFMRLDSQSLKYTNLTPLKHSSDPEMLWVGALQQDTTCTGWLVGPILGSCSHSRSLGRARPRRFAKHRALD